MRATRPLDLLPILLIAVMGWQVVGSVPFLVERAQLRKEIKHRIKAGVPDEERVRFSFSVKAYDRLDWFEPGKEFMLHGRMYDIVERTRLHDGTILLECIDDVQETMLFASLDQAVRGGMEMKTAGRTERCRVVNLHAQFHESVAGSFRWIQHGMDRQWPLAILPRPCELPREVIDPPPRA